MMSKVLSATRHSMRLRGARSLAFLAATSQRSWFGSLPRATALSPSLSTTLSTTSLLCAMTTPSVSAFSTEATMSTPVEHFRKDYTPLSHVVPKVDLNFDLWPGKTTVTSELWVEPNPASTAASTSTYELDGDAESVTLVSVECNDQLLKPNIDYVVTPHQLQLLQVPSGSFRLKVVVELDPKSNTQLSGLYQSHTMYCTQCEAEGFRRITYFPDRPDNMAVFNVRVEANPTDYPILLSNGNLVEQGAVSDTTSTPGERHYAIWQDPFPKPSYLFALVAGDLGQISDSYTTQSGREVHLQILSEPHNVHKLHYAMESLKRSMKWDEDKYGLEYDLDLYNVVAVDDFNMGAMENKGLNVFNTAYVLAHPDTATDTDFERVEGVIGHEYFHNWTGNRVTCRDWFQLTLKEGLTVFRDQEFSGDMNSKPVNRIENVVTLRGRQFAEDAGPMSHPIRPESYISMDNFYTPTVYEKGAEIIRMYQTILGETGFRKGMDLYFARHDGSAVTCDDFLAAMADANDQDLSQFSRWYSTPGTPTVTYEYTQENGKFQLTLTQSSNSNLPLHIPVSIGLLDKETGTEVLPTTVLHFTEERQEFEFEVSSPVVPSILRHFSAPVKLEAASESEADLAFLAARDTDGFNKWESGQKLFTASIFQTMNKSSGATWEYVKEAFGRTLLDRETTDRSIVAYALTLPSEATLEELVDVVDPLAIHEARETTKQALARAFHGELQERYDELTRAVKAEKEFKVDADSIGLRRLRNVCLDYLCSIRETPEEQVVAAQLAKEHFDHARGMTDKVAALRALVSMSGTQARERALADFYEQADGDALVLNKWFTLQATADVPDILDQVKALRHHKDFTLTNPNRCRSLVAAFTTHHAFHNADGAGYEFLGEILEELDRLNPQISSRLAKTLIQWRKYDAERGARMKAQLQRLAEIKPISPDLFEVVSRGLQ